MMTQGDKDRMLLLVAAPNGTEDIVTKCRLTLEYIESDCIWSSPGTKFFEQCAFGLRELVKRGQPLALSSRVFDRLVERLAVEFGPTSAAVSCLEVGSSCT